MNTRLVIFLLVCLPLYLRSQCLTPPVFPGCTPVGSLSVSTGTVINAASTYHHSGTSTLSSLTLNGGRLIVCGNLTLSSFVFNSGEIYVQAGSSFTVNNGGTAVVFGANSRIYNYGTTTFNISIVTGSNNVLMNCLPGSVFNIPFDQLVLQGPNTFFVNNGSWQSSFFIIQSTNSANNVCLGNGSTTTTNTMINQFANSVIVPSGNACFRVIQNIINSQPVTTNPNLYVCLAPGVSTISGPNWGSASIFPTCMTCAVPLPIELVNFTGHNEYRDNILEWTTASESNNCYFQIERSLDCIHFDVIDTVDGAVNSNHTIHYSGADKEIKYNQLYYYRLKQVDCDGNFTYSSPIALTANYNENDWRVWPNPASEIVNVHGPEPVLQVVLYNTLGQRVIASDGNTLNVSGVNAGSYFLFIIPGSNGPVVKELVIIR